MRAAKRAETYRRSEMTILDGVLYGFVLIVVLVSLIAIIKEITK